jgi:hypothetical protein
MSQDQFHWLVIRSSEHLIAKSRELYESGAAVVGRVDPERVSQYIPIHGQRLAGGVPSAHYVPSVSGGTMHYEVSAAAFESGELAIAWASSEQGVTFLKHRHDAVLIAIRKPD